MWCAFLCVPSVTPVEPRRPLHPRRNPAPAGGREGAGDDELEPALRCMSLVCFGGLNMIQVEPRRSFVEAGSPGVGTGRAGDNGIYV
jgi:hypothetical protein